MIGLGRGWDEGDEQVELRAGNYVDDGLLGVYVSEPLNLGFRPGREHRGLLRNLDDWV